MKNLLILLLCTAVQFVSAQEKIKLPAIHTLLTSDVASVNVISGEENYIIFKNTEHPEMTPYSVKDGVLEVSGISKATVVLKSLKNIKAADASKIMLTAGSKFSDLNVSAEDAADINLNGSFNSLNINAEDGTKVMIVGSTNSVMADISDVARVNGMGANNKYVKVNVHDNGLAEFPKIDEKEISDQGFAGNMRKIQTDKDTTRILTKEKEIIITDREDEDDDMEIEDDMEDDTSKIYSDIPNKTTEAWKKHFSRARVWTGLELSLNGFSEKLFKFEPTENANLAIEQPSVAIHLNLLEKSFKLGTEYLKFVTGLGFQFDVYKFKDSGLRMENTKNNVNFYSVQTDYSRNRLILNQFVVPALININTNPGRRNFHIDAGVILGVRFKQKHQLENKEEYKTVTEIESKSSFHQNPFNIAGTVRLGFSSWSIFGMYDINSLYKKNEGPQIHTWHAGITIVPF